MQLVLGPASSYAEFLATIRILLSWLNGPPAVPFAVQWQPFGASEPGYLDVVGATHNIPNDEAQWLRLQAEPVEIMLIVRPGIRYPRQTLSNLVVNPGFEAPFGPAVTVFNDTLANVSAYASQVGAAPTAGSVNNGYADVVVADVPLRYYRMQEASGATAYDVSGQGQNGTYQSSPTLGVTSPISGEPADKAITLNGTSHYLSVPTTGLPSASAAVSLEVWFRITANPATTPRALAFLGTTTASQAVFLQVDTSGRVSAQLWGGASTPNSSAVALNAWHHAVLTYTGGANGTLTLYLDGSSIGTATITAAVLLGSCEFGRAAGSASVTFLPGSVDAAAVYATALSSARVTAHWNAGNAGTGMGTMANVFTLASGARVAFGSPGWAAINTRQTRFRFVSGLTARWYLHYTDASNYLRASLSGTTLAIEQTIAGVTTTLATVALIADNLVWYWLRLTQFPTPPARPVVRGFRTWLLAHDWDKDDWPLAPEQTLDSVEPGNAEIGAGTRQDFRMTSLGWTQTRGVYHIWSGQDLVALQHQLDEDKTEIADLRHRLAAAQQGQATDDAATKALAAVKALADALKGM